MNSPAEIFWERKRDFSGGSPALEGRDGVALKAAQPPALRAEQKQMKTGIISLMANVKIVTFVPIADADKVREALGSAGAGQIGEYNFCSYSVIGKGRFVPSDKANPLIGVANELETVEEERIEVICERAKAKAVIDAMRQAHPYEEVAFDVYPLINEDEL